MPNAKPKDHLWPAIAFACINALMLAGMGLFAKLLGQYFGFVEVTFFRNILSLAVLFLWLFFTHKLFLLKTERPWAHIFRSIVGTLGIASGMLAVSILPLAEATILLFTSPLWTLLLAWIFLKEHIGPYRISAIILGFIGIIILANPFDGHIGLPLLGLAAGLFWGFISGAVDTILRWMGSTEKSATTTFYFMLIGSILCSLHWPFAEIQDNSFSTPALWIMCGLGVTGLLAQLSKSQSFRLGEASIIAPVMYTMIIWSVLFDYLFWNKVPTWNVIVGATVIICANFIILYRERQKEHENLKSSASY
jgi:drug/metabolite transporter (DMT)-like permease